MFTHPECEKMRNLWKPKTLREEQLSQSFEDLFIADAERSGGDDWARKYNVKFADRVRLMDEFADISPRRFADIWNYQAILWRNV